MICPESRQSCFELECLRLGCQGWEVIEQYRTGGDARLARGRGPQRVAARQESHVLRTQAEGDLGGLPLSVGRIRPEKAAFVPARRRFLGALAALVAAPAIVRASSLMPVRPLLHAGNWSADLDGLTGLMPEHGVLPQYDLLKNAKPLFPPEHLNCRCLGFEDLDGWLARVICHSFALTPLMMEGRHG